MRCRHTISIRLPGGPNEGERQDVPCGKCGACLSNKRDEWSIRLQEEARINRNGYFITLTYMDQEIPMNDEGYYSLEKRDLNLFLKNIRSKIDRLDWDTYSMDMYIEKPEIERYHKMMGIKKKARVLPFRYYAIGEYGSKFERPHYHVIGFNIPMTVLREVQECWNKGIVDIGKAEQGSIHYVAGYHVTANKKKRRETPGVFETKGLVPTGELTKTGRKKKRLETIKIDGVQEEFAVMSRRPAIGFSYIDNYYNWHIDNDKLVTDIRGFEKRMPRYYKERIFF